MPDPLTVTPELRRALLETYTIADLKKIREEKVRRLDTLDRIVNASTGGGTSYQREEIVRLPEYIALIQSIIEEKENRPDDSASGPTRFIFNRSAY